MNNPVIIALDFHSLEEAWHLVQSVGPVGNFYKVGMELYAAGGLPFIDRLHRGGKRIFLDLKLYDIGETVKRATRYLCKKAPIEMLTVHGSRAVMEAAAEGRGDSEVMLLGVTVLTSFDATDLADLGFLTPLENLVALRVRNATATGMNGVVCSPREVAQVRDIAGPDLLLVTPGVRSEDSDVGDQKRISTPAEAVRNGANYLVIGREITRAEQPRRALEKIIDTLV